MKTPQSWHAQADAILKDEPKIGRRKLARLVGVTAEVARGYLDKKVHHVKPLSREALLESIKSPISYSDLQVMFNIDRERLDVELRGLFIHGYQVVHPHAKSELLMLKRVATPSKEVVKKDWNGNTVIRFGEVSDTHLCSVFQQLTFLKYAYETFAREGITTVYHAGDIVDGYGMRRGHEYEVFAHGADAQTAYVKKNYPYNPTIKTEFITGNHDLSFIVSSGHDIGKAIANVREDLIYHGPELCQINLTPNCKLELWHGRDGSAYATSYAIQKYVEAMPGGDKPNILFAGHRHKAIYLPYRNVHAFEGGCIQAQTGFMRGKKLHAAVGFWIVEIEVTPDGTITRLKQEFYPQYKSIKDDY